MDRAASPAKRRTPLDPVRALDRLNAAVPLLVIHRGSASSIVALIKHSNRLLRQDLLEKIAILFFPEGGKDFCLTNK